MSVQHFRTMNKEHRLIGTILYMCESLRLCILQIHHHNLTMNNNNETRMSGTTRFQCDVIIVLSFQSAHNRIASEMQQKNSKIDWRISEVCVPTIL